MSSVIERAKQYLTDCKRFQSDDILQAVIIRELLAEIERLRARLAAMTAAPENTHAQCPMCKLAIRPSLTNNGIGPVWHAVHCGWGHEMLSPNMTEEYAAAYNAGYKEAVDVTQSKYLALGATIDRLNAERADYQGRTGELRAEIERLRYDADMYHAMCNKLWAVVQPNGMDDCASIASAEIGRLRKALRHNAESHESLAVLLGNGTRITTQGFVMAVCQCERYAQEARAALNPPRREEASNEHD